MKREDFVVGRWYRRVRNPGVLWSIGDHAIYLKPVVNQYGEFRKLGEVTPRLGLYSAFESLGSIGNVTEVTARMLEHAERPVVKAPEYMDIKIGRKV